MKTKLPLSAATKLLTNEFARLRTNCRTCSVPMMLWGPSPEGIGGQWRLKALPYCTNGCHTLVLQIWGEITEKHDIEPTPDHAPIRKGRRPVKV